MNKKKLIESLKIECFGHSYTESVIIYVDIVEHLIFTGNINEAKELLEKLGFKAKNYNKFIKSIINKYDDDEAKYLKMIINNKVKRKTLN